VQEVNAAHWRNGHIDSRNHAPVHNITKERTTRAQIGSLCRAAKLESWLVISFVSVALVGFDVGFAVGLVVGSVVGLVVGHVGLLVGGRVPSILKTSQSKLPEVKLRCWQLWRRKQSPELLCQETHVQRGVTVAAVHKAIHCSAVVPLATGCLSLSITDDP